MTGPKRIPNILLWDVETSPIVAAIWSLNQKGYINPSHILEDWWMISAAWKWVGETKIHSVSVLDDKKRFKKDHTDDYHVISELHKVLSNADVIVHHNGDRFDLKKFNARAVFHGFKPIPKPVTVDTLKVAKKHFSFTSNRLDYLDQYLGGEGKRDSSFSLWKGALRGDKKAIEGMVTYNIGDIPTLERVYVKLRPYMDNHPNLNLFVERPEEGCPKCLAGPESLDPSHYRATRTALYMRWQCRACGGWTHSGKSEKRADKR